MIGKPKDIIIADMQRRLQNSFPELQFGPGSVARALVADVADEIAEAYDALDYVLRMTDLSRARGQYLDMIGQLVGIYRSDDELDEAYRARIAASELLRADSNETALRLRCLAQPMVRDVIIQKWSHGPGSCTIFVVPTDRSFDDMALNGVQSVISEHGAAGIRFNVTKPRDIVIDLSVALVFPDGMPRYRADALARSVKEQLSYYLNNLAPGDTMRDTDIIKTARNASSEIIDMDVYEFAVNNTRRAFCDIKANWNERFAPGKIRVR